MHRRGVCGGGVRNFFKKKNMLWGAGGVGISHDGGTRTATCVSRISIAMASGGISTGTGSRATSVPTIVFSVLATRFVLPLLIRLGKFCLQPALFQKI